MSKARIAQILNITESNAWFIADHVDDLWLTQLAPDANLNTYMPANGAVVHLEEGIIIPAQTIPITLMADQLVPSQVDGLIHLTDLISPDIEYTFDPKSDPIYLGYEGVDLRVFSFNNKVYYATNTRLESQDTTVGIHHKTIKQIYDQLNGPTDIADRTVYNLLLVHPDVQVVSQLDLADGFILDKDNMSVVDLATANTYLKPVDVADQRLNEGEFIWVKNYKIQSPAYQWRAAMRDGTTDLLYQFYLLTNMRDTQVQYPDALQTFLERFPVFNVDTLEVLTGVTPVDLLDTSDKRLYNIYLAFLSALPVSQKQVAVGFYDTFKQRMEQLIKWFSSLYLTEQYKSVILPVRAKRIFSNAQIFAQERAFKGDNTLFSSLVTEELAKLLNVEESSNLYNFYVYYSGN